MWVCGSLWPTRHGLLKVPRVKCWLMWPSTRHTTSSVVALVAGEVMHALEIGRLHVLLYLVAIMALGNLLSDIIEVFLMYHPSIHSWHSPENQHLQVHPPWRWWLVIFRSCRALPAWFGDLDAMATWSKWPSKDHFQLFGRSLDESSGVEDSSTRGNLRWSVLNEVLICSTVGILYTVFISFYFFTYNYYMHMCPVFIFYWVSSCIHLFIYSIIHRSMIYLYLSSWERFIHLAESWFHGQWTCDQRNSKKLISSPGCIWYTYIHTSIQQFLTSMCP